MNERRVGFYLERIDPAANMRRFYYAFVAATILAPVCVVRMHGRLGGWQRTLPPLEFRDEAQATAWLLRQRRRKLKRGYTEEVDEHRSSMAGEQDDRRPLQPSKKKQRSSTSQLALFGD